jgi:hypothetical protein
MLTAEESLIPYIMPSHNSSPSRKHLKRHGVRFGRDVNLKSNQKLCISAAIFLDYIRTVFSTYIDTLPGLAVFVQEVAVFFMNHCSAHIRDHVIRILIEARARVKIYAPRTAQIVQVLDLTLFGVFEMRSRYELLFEDDSAAFKFLMKE